MQNLCVTLPFVWFRTNWRPKISLLNALLKWERHHDFETEDNIKAFLCISCRNACLDYLRRLKVKSNAQEAYYSQLIDSEETILYQIVKSELLGALNKEIELLPDNYRQVFRYIYALATTILFVAGFSMLNVLTGKLLQYPYLVNYRLLLLIHRI